MNLKHNKSSVGSFCREIYGGIIDQVSSGGSALHMKIKCERELGLLSGSLYHIHASSSRKQCAVTQ
jgi:hypothetical protein